MENKVIRQRIDVLRTWMKENGLSAFIFPSTDPHSGEYVPDYWMARQWISGFNGSAGTAVVTLTDAALWTDSRYFLAATEQLEGTGFQLMKQGLSETPSIAEWLGSTLDEGETVGMDGWVNTITSVMDMEAELEEYGLELNTELDPTESLWEGRPELPDSPIEIHPIELAGESAQSKIKRVREKLEENGCEALMVSQLDEIAWLLNLRGKDVHCNPVFVSYVIVKQDECTLYINPKKVTASVAEYLKKEGVSIKNYDSIADDLENYEGENIMMDYNTSNNQLWALLPSVVILNEKSPIAPMKAVKNEAEIRGYRSAMLKDGIAMVKFLHWLKPAVEAGGQTEMSIDQKLTSLRAEQPLYRDISFDTIAGYGPHGAIVHYEATPETDIPLEPHGLLLLDSGAQYQDGTTDITRTIALGPLTEEERHDYTLVLRGHIRLAMVKFPAGSSGTQMDICARYAMWQEGINYLHGTGHGVGSFLNVHEGPHQFRMNYMPAPFVANMTVTNEPGIYKTGKHGCRTENTMLVTHYMDGEFGEFLQLEPLTLCPIDTTPINLNEMQQDEIDYLNWYHGWVRETLLPHLDDEADKEWLIEATEEVKK
ncbi:MAG: aminopeptidase P family protein [Bacteroidaceae bacterium]|nr:aminopeptidase P family protein [Bacteroidaceae bacterium]